MVKYRWPNIPDKIFFGQISLTNLLAKAQEQI
jgi:hypothetical protein